MNNMPRAKEIFFSYDGLFFHMDRDGEYEKYKTYKVPRSVEEEWILEIHDKYISQINEISDNPTGIERYSYCFNTKLGLSTVSRAIISLEKVFNNYCTFGKIRAAESLLDLLQKIHDKNIREDLIILFKNINSSITKPYTVSKYYEKSSYLIDILTESKLDQRFEELINKTQNLLTTQSR